MKVVTPVKDSTHQSVSTVRAAPRQSRRLVAEPNAPLDLILPSDLEFDE